MHRIVMLQCNSMKYLLSSSFRRTVVCSLCVRNVDKWIQWVFNVQQNQNGENNEVVHLCTIFEMMLPSVL